MKTTRAPSFFVSHGAPTELIGKGPWQLALETTGRLVQPRAVIVMSAHWRVKSGFDIGYQSNYTTIHDFSGFPKELSEFHYPAKGHRDLAEQCIALLRNAAIESKMDEDRGLDHGVYVPLHHLWKNATIPVIPIAISMKATPQQIFRVGEILAPLRNEGVMILGSGGMVHNLAALTWDDPSNSKPEAWAAEFQSWVFSALEDGDFNALCDFQTYGPHCSLAHKTWEHFAPLLFVAGAASAWKEVVQQIYLGWTFGNLSMACVGYGHFLGTHKDDK